MEEKKNEVQNETKRFVPGELVACMDGNVEDGWMPYRYAGEVEGRPDLAACTEFDEENTPVVLERSACRPGSEVWPDVFLGDRRFAPGQLVAQQILDQVRIRVVVIAGGKNKPICCRLDRSDSYDGDGGIRPAQEIWPDLCFRPDA